MNGQQRVKKLNILDAMWFPPPFRRETLMAKITIEYCSQFKSYNGEPVRPGYVLAPFIVTDEMYRHDNSLIKKNTRIWRQFGAKIRVGFIVVHKNDFEKILFIFNSGIRAYFQDNPELIPGRCQIGMANNGMP